MSYQTKKFHRAPNESLSHVKESVFDWISNQGRIDILKIKFLTNPEGYEVTYRTGLPQGSLARMCNHR